MFSKINKFTLISIGLLIAGICLFIVSGYLYWALNDLYETLAYYHIESLTETNSKMSEHIFNLKFGIIKCSILGFVSWILSLVFFLKRKRSFNNK